MKGIEEKQIEAPYELPEGWKWVSIGECCEKAFSGKSPKYSKEETPYKIIGQQANQRYGIDLKFVKFGTQEYAEAQADFYYLQYNDVILNTLGTGSIGRSGIYKYHEKILTDGHPFVFRTGTKYSPDLLFYYLRLNEQEIINTANGSTNQKFLSLKTFSKFPIPLPPTLDEQQRIVNRIESMFAKLDEAKEKAQNVVDGFETRKAAILHKAFTNKLKIENGKLKDEEWKERKLGEICEVTSSKRVYQTEQTSSGIPFLRIADIMCKIQNKDVFPELFISAERYKKLQSQNLVPKENEILVTSRGTLGKCYLIKKDDMFYFQDGMISWLKNIDRNISSQYLIYLFQSKEITNQIEEMQNGSTVNYLSISMLKKISIPIPPFNFQLSIVNFLDSVLEKERTAKEAAENVLEQIDLLKKSILARAFRGEL